VIAVAAAVALAFIAAFAAAPAQAQGRRARAEQASRDREARSLFDAGRTAFAAGRFEDALADFERSYALSERADLLYNVAVCLERLRRDDEAIGRYRAYLDESDPESPNRDLARSRIAFLEEQAASRDDAPPVEPEPDGEADADRSVWEETWIWPVLASAAIGVTVGIVMLATGGDEREPPIPGTVGGVVMTLGSW
jgi:tetratricopeptide (TPR) repeat protein